MIPYPVFGTVLVPLAMCWKAISSPVVFLLQLAGATSVQPKLPTIDMSDRVVIVTGANTGIGKQTALSLAGMGATVVMACRSMERGEGAKADIERTLSEGDDARIKGSGADKRKGKVEVRWLSRWNSRVAPPWPYLTSVVLRICLYSTNKLVYQSCGIKALRMLRRHLVGALS
ncbi:unnamed protein product [Discosporangium mesarthrocarpum]